MSVPESNFRAWLAKAENDALNIQNNLAAARVPWDTICFHAQQVAEKSLAERIRSEIASRLPKD